MLSRCAFGAAVAKGLDLLLLCTVVEGELVFLGGPSFLGNVAVGVAADDCFFLRSIDFKVAADNFLFISCSCKETS